MTPLAAFHARAAASAALFIAFAICVPTFASCVERASVTPPDSIERMAKGRLRARFGIFWKCAWAKFGGKKAVTIN